MKYQCKDCIYSYNPEIGDPKQGIEAGTAFIDVPNSWTCPMCGAKKERFRKI